MSKPETASEPMPDPQGSGISPATRGEDGFRVGPWSVDPKGGLLRRGAELVRVERKVMDVLVYFAGRSGEVVSREELERDVWRLGRAYFFIDDQVQALINLREAAMRNPEVLEVRVFLAAALELGGEHQDAEWEAEEIRAIHPDFSTDTWLETYPMTDRDQQQRLIKTLARLGL